MTPYYEHAGITIYHADCRDVLPLINADALVTDLGRRAIGIEIEERYCEIAAKRIAQETLFGVSQ